MARPGRLAEPPIKEALVDLRTVRTSKLEGKALESLWPQIKERYPQLEAQHRFETNVETRVGKLPDVQTQDLGFYGLILRSQNNSLVAQFRVDGLAVSQLLNYTTADDLFAEAIDLWERYEKLAQPDQVVRIALRYINRLALSFLPGEDFRRLLTAAVVTPPTTPQEVLEFLTRVVVPISAETQTAAIITQRLEPNKAEGEPTGFILDIDVFRSGIFPKEPAQLLPILQGLREVKNQLFFGYVTDEALEPYR